MKTTPLILSVLGAAAIGAAGYWLGARHAPAAAGHLPTSAASAAAPAKPLYYRNPMGLADTSPMPKKDGMGMDYIPVYADAEAPAANSLRIPLDKVQKLGVRTEPAALRALAQTLRASGRVEPDEQRITTIAPRYEGTVEQLRVNVSGQAVAKGQPLFEAYSPDLVSAQREYLIALQGSAVPGSAAGSHALPGMTQLAEASLARLRQWDVAPEQIAALVRTGEVRRTVTFVSPAAGIVTEKKAQQGMRFMPGEMLYQVSDLSSVWVVADVPEQDIGRVRVGAPVQVTLVAWPGRTFEGKVLTVVPTLRPETRTVPVRIALPNPGLRLLPAMFAQVDIQVGARAPVLAVPWSAVIDSGTRQIVLVQRQEGRFEAREVRLGAHGDSHVEVLSGLSAGEPVVVSANFLIDAESNLRAAISGLGAPASSASATH